ncbi:MAG: DUF3307 domain-containing protein [Actinomycetota bacterium]|nr:DUF3307 domain-containing protein [Actinomycetota bacterium]
MSLFYLLLLVHLVVDFMQPASLVKWAKQSFLGLITHSGIYSLLTAMVLAPYSHRWLLWTIVLGLSHFLFDRFKINATARKPTASLYIFIGDQVLHLFVMGMVFFLTELRFVSSLHIPYSQFFPYLVGYIAATFGGSILIYEFCNTFSRAGPTGSAPPVGEPASRRGNNTLYFHERFVGIVERGLAVTFILVDFYFLVPFAFILSIIKVIKGNREYLLILEFASSLVLAIIVGLILRTI